MFKIFNPFKCSFKDGTVTLIDQTELYKYQYLLIKVLFKDEDRKEAFNLLK